MTLPRTGFRSYPHRFFKFFTSWNSEKRRNTMAVGGTVGMVALAYASIQKVPPGHVGMVKQWNGEVKNVIYDDEQFFLFVPVAQTPVLFRLFPVKKRLTGIFTTKDEKKVEVMVQIRLQPKLAFCRDIYLAFGLDYGRGFVKAEATQDVEQVVKEYTYDELVNEDSKSDQAIDDMVERFRDACAFYRLCLSEVNVVFRDADEEEEEEEEE